MPISPEKRKLYPDNWKEISRLVRDKAGGLCELCKSPEGHPHFITGGKVVLTVHHKNGDPTDRRKLNLIALCQRCHNILDQPFRRKKKPEGRLFEKSDKK